MVTDTGRKRWSGGDDEAIRAASEVLDRLEDDPRLCVDPHDVRVMRLRPELWGCVDSERDGGPLLIYVSSLSLYYRRAEIGDLLGLAVLIHHEQYHVVHGREEGPAYRASLGLLERAGARELAPHLIAEVEQARDAAVCREDAAFNSGKSKSSTSPAGTINSR